MTPLMKFRLEVPVGVSSVIFVSPGCKESFKVGTMARSNVTLQDTAKPVQIQRLLARGLNRRSDRLLEREGPLDVRGLHHQIRNAWILLDFGRIVADAALVDGHQQRTPADGAVK